MREEAGRSLVMLETIEASFRETPGYPEAMPAFVFYPWPTLRHGLARRRALVEWIDECLTLLDRRPSSADADAASAMSELMKGIREITREVEPASEKT